MLMCVGCSGAPTTFVVVQQVVAGDAGEATPMAEHPAAVEASDAGGAVEEAEAMPAPSSTATSSPTTSPSEDAAVEACVPMPESVVCAITYSTVLPDGCGGSYRCPAYVAPVEAGSCSPMACPACVQEAACCKASGECGCLYGYTMCI